MKKIILFAITCFCASQTYALGGLTIINGTSDHDLFIEPRAVAPSCYPELSAYATHVNNYYFNVAPNQTLYFGNFADFNTNYVTPVTFSLNLGPGAGGASLTPTQAQAYAPLVEWSYFLFKSFHHINIGTAGTSGYLGLQNSSACHNDPSVSIPHNNTVASTFTIGTETYFIIS